MSIIVTPNQEIISAVRSMSDREKWHYLREKADEAKDDINLGNGVGFDLNSKMYGRINPKTGRVTGTLFVTEGEVSDYIKEKNQ